MRRLHVCFVSRRFGVSCVGAAPDVRSDGESRLFFPPTPGLFFCVVPDSFLFVCLFSSFLLFWFVCFLLFVFFPLDSNYG